jgi:hypothetical protein
MKPTLAYPKTVAALTVASGLLALLCLVLLSIALADHPEAIKDPVQILNVPGVNAALLRGSMLADMLGYYLLLLPLIYYLRPYLSGQTRWAGVITFCGLAYVLIGAIGAAVMAEVASRLYADYYASSPAGQTQIRVVYQAVIYLVYEGLWNLLGSLLAGLWWFLTGYFLHRFHKATARTALLLGSFTALDAIGNLLGIGWLAETGLNVYLVLAPVWAILMGVVVWNKARKTVPSSQSLLEV